MHIINAVNVNDAYVRGLRYLAENWITQQSRNGPVLVAMDPVTTHYRHPTHRVLFSPQRDANPFFHLFEALWMLDGQRDVVMPAYFVPRMADFSDDGRVFHAAYGHRWRQWPVTSVQRQDQIEKVISILRSDPNSRRAIVAMWDPARDQITPPTTARDLPCNTTIKFSLSDGQLNMVVFNRSNDIILGAYGANVVHMSILQEYVATRLRAEVGYYEQISCDYHAYVEQWNKVWPMGADNYQIGVNPYDDTARIRGRVPVFSEPLMSHPDSFDAECHLAVCAAREEPHILGWDIANGMDNRFFSKVCHPMLFALNLHKAKQTENGVLTLRSAIEMYGPIDWLVASMEWLERRAAKR